MKPLRVEFDLTSDDVAAAAETVADRDPRAREARAKAQRVLAVVILVIAVFLAVDYGLRKPRVYTASMGVLGGAAVAMVLRFPTRRAWGEAARMQAAAVFTTPAGKACLGPRSVEVTRDGIAFASCFARTLVTWRGVIDVMPTADLLVVLLPGPVYLCVPRRAFQTDGDFEQFGQTVADLAAAGGGLTGRAPPTGEARGM